MTQVDEIMSLVESHRVSGGHQEHRATKETLRTAIEALVIELEAVRRANLDCVASFNRMREALDSESESCATICDAYGQVTCAVHIRNRSKDRDIS